MSGPDGAATPPRRPSAGQTLGAMWLYTLLRFGMFLVLWGLLWLARVPGLLAGLIALVLSVPLSFVLLRRPRERVAQNLQQRVAAKVADRSDLDARLSGAEVAADDVTAEATLHQAPHDSTAETPASKDPTSGTATPGS